MNPTSGTHRAQALYRLGWSSFFTSQLQNEVELNRTMRVMSVRRNILETYNGEEEQLIHAPDPSKGAERPVVGDWILIDPASMTVTHILERQNLLQRSLAEEQRVGSDVKIQPIVANTHRVFIVSSCNEEFNESRLERFLVLCRETGVPSTIVLTKSDLCDQPQTYLKRVNAIHPRCKVYLIDARQPHTVQALLHYFEPNLTITLLGSSGVGKSTLVNTLTGLELQMTQDVRAHDKRGRHTTSERKLICLPKYGLVADMPGLRSVGVFPSKGILNECFPDIADLALSCRFANCQHRQEPGCRIRQAIKSNQLSNRRLTNYQKMLN